MLSTSILNVLFMIGLLFFGDATYFFFGDKGFAAVAFYVVGDVSCELRCRNQEPSVTIPFQLQLVTFGNPYYLLLCSTKLQKAFPSLLKLNKTEVNVINVAPKPPAAGGRAA